MSRAHFNRAIVDPEGNLLPGCSVRVIDSSDGTTTLADTLYADDTTSAMHANPFVATDGVIDFYLATPRRVRLGITRTEPGSIEYYIEDMDVFAPVV